jgi:flagellar hook-basal body protein
MNYGTVTDTQNPLDVALTGPGMFVLAKNASGTVPTQTPDTFQFTRNGQFGVDANNRIVNENGMFIVGYPANVDGKSINKSQFSILTLDQTPMAAKQTSASTIAMNLDNRGNPIQATFDPTQVNSYTQTTSQTVYDAGGNQHTLSTYYVKQNPATLYFYPQNGGTNPTTATIFAFNPNQDISAAADQFSATQNLASVPKGVDAAHSMATTATPATGSAVTNETLSGVTLTAYPPGQNSTYQMTMADGTQIMVTAQQTTNAQGQTVVRYGYAADRYQTYLTVDGINVNRSIATNSQVGQGYMPSSALIGSATTSITASGATPGSYTVALDGGATATVTVSGAVGSATVTGYTVSGGSGYSPGQTLIVKAGSLGSGSSAVTLNNSLPTAQIGGILNASHTGTTIATTGTVAAGTYTGTIGIGSPAANCSYSLTVSGNQVTAYTVTSPSTGQQFVSEGLTSIPINVTGGSFTIPISTNDFLGTTVSSVSVGGALAGSAAAGNYTIGVQNTVGGLTGNLVPPSTIAGLGGIAGTYTVNVNTSGLGTGGVATINYGGNGSITSIQLSGGTGYNAGDTLSIPAGSLGAGSAAVANLGALISTNTVNGTQLTLSNGTGTPIPSAQTIIAGAAGGVQTFTFSNGVTFTLNTPATDTVAGIAAGMNNKVITVSNNPVGTMAFVAGKNTDGLQRDQFGVPAYTTKTSLSTTVGSAVRVNQLALTIDSTDMTAYSAAQSTYTNTQDGNSLAQLTAYTVDNSGILQATYDNGHTLMKGQLAIANFNNTAGLIPVGNNSFEMSGITGLQSGDAIFGTANSGNLGAIRSKAVESSNVDLTAELVKLMTLQRQYTANSQAVKVEAATIVDDAIRIGQ